MRPYKIISAILLLAAVDSPAQDVVSLLRGNVAGVRVSSYDGGINSPFSVNVRGVNSYRFDSQPIWIVDGAVLNNAQNQNTDAFYNFGEQSWTSALDPLTFLNAADIESIEVVKDMSSMARYGVRGANGAVIVRTKKNNGKEGVRVNLSSDLILNSAVPGNDAFRTGVGHQHTLSVTGGINNNNFAVSGFFRDNNAPYRRGGNTYGGLRASFETTANKVVHFSMNSLLSLGEMSSMAGTSYFGQPSYTLSARYPELFLNDTVSGWQEDYDDIAQDKRAVNSLSLDFNLPLGFKISLNAGMDYQRNDRYIWYGNGLSFGKDNNGAASILGSSMFRYNADMSLRWHRYFGNHLLKLGVSASTSSDMNTFSNMCGTDFFTHELRAMGLNQHGSRPQIHNFDYRYSDYAVYPELEYSFGKILSLNALYRCDWTPKYHASVPESYYSIELRGDLREAFFKNSSAVSGLAVRAGYGKSGMDHFVPYGMFGNYITGDYLRVDPELEFFYEALGRVTSRELNAGIDVSFLEGRFSASLGYFHKMTDDNISIFCFGKPVPDSYLWVWSDAQELQNLSSGIRNTGLELSLDIALIRNGNFRWNISANGAYNVNQASSICDSDVDGKQIGNGLTANVNALGHQLNSFYGYRTNFDGSYRDITSDGYISGVDRVLIGNPFPSFYGGFGTNVSIKGFSLDLLFDGAAGFDVLNLNRLLAEGTKPYAVSDRYVEDADFLRLSRATVSYEVPLNRTGCLKSLKVSLSGRNLATFSRYTGWNPDVNCFGNSGFSTGIDYGAFPVTRTFMMGVSLMF
ncbi:MAG: TonB-dependent receptor [Bacteroidales bacterium]|nr:TonB-dependent receptor [Bacteroidales bacterium]